MSYVLFNVNTTVQIGNDYPTLRGVKIASTCYMKRNINAEIDYLPRDVYNETIIHKKTVKHLLTGEPIVIDSNTPYCCDPSYERYWSM